MKLWRYILLLGVFVMLILPPAAQPVTAQSGITLTPGVYVGKYNLTVVSVTAAGNDKGKILDTYKLSVEGPIDIIVSANNSAMASASTDFVGLYQIHTLQIKVEDFSCTAWGTLIADAQVSWFAPLTNNYNPGNNSFTLPSFSIENITNSSSTVSSSSEKCNYPVSVETMRKWIDEISARVNQRGKAQFDVYEASERRLAGAVWIPGWDGTIAGPMGAVTQEAAGYWFALRVQEAE